MAQPISSKNFSLHDLVTSNVVTHDVQLHEEKSRWVDYNHFLKEKWDSLKSYAHPNIKKEMLDVEKTFIASCQNSGECKLGLSEDERARFLEMRINDLFRKFAEGFETTLSSGEGTFLTITPVGMELHCAKQQQLEDRALQILWNEAIVPALGNNPLDVEGVEFPPAIEIRAWLGLDANKEFLEKITTLHLQGRDLKVIPPEIARFVNLVKLNISTNQLLFIPDFIGDLKFLKILFVQNNQITSIPDCLAKLIHLESFYANSNQISSFPSFFCKLPNLQKLEFWHNPIRTISIKKGHFGSLKDMLINLSDIPDNIDNLSRLEVLRIDTDEKGIERFGKISTIPKSIAALANLKILNLSNSNITSIPESFGNLTNLEELEMDGNLIMEIDDCFGRCVQLQRLSLCRNKITFIPKCIAQLQNLKSLSLNENEIEILPEYLDRLTLLESLYLVKNWIVEIPECYSSLTQMRMFSINLNQIKAIPECLGNLHQLTHLSMTENAIEEIPDSIGGLGNLQWLHLHNNAIRSIPNTFSGLVNLEILQLNSNAISHIPDCVGEMAGLRELCLNDNRISIVPLCLRDLHNLFIVELMNNRISIRPDFNDFEGLMMKLEGNPFLEDSSAAEEKK